MELALGELLDERLITLDLQATEREGAIRELAGLIDRAGKLADRDEYVNAVLAREALGSTGVGHGVAIPHGKSPAVREAAVAFGRSRTGVDFAAPDGRPADLVFLIAAPEGAHDLHLKALAHLARRLVHDEVREALRQAGSAHEVVRVLAQA
ncbi:PTS sugar transporter subunit IIA [Caldinitratiruptor microaerophilus]|uniref:PTS fructose transporter subunit IIA n=1 Tax=Caldinitratiruptor microaerophilus TaxID=671077 RepID=A0AA35CLH5_9FIRM|nr:fructose PTS transporter subunit IIA [Caldinitratiruptor microaerophilus]BDG59485.1 PTS fructose transporter subunit IIA [Caldinitratiruptor microaerophilus]